MKKAGKWVSFVLAAMMLVTAAAGCGSKSSTSTQASDAKKQTFTVGFDAEYAPYGYMKDLDKDSRDRLISFFSLMFKSNMLLVLEDIHEGSEKIAHTAKKWAFKRIAEEKT